MQTFPRVKAMHVGIAAMLVLVPTIAFGVEKSTTLKPPVNVTGSLSKALFTVTQTGAAPGVSVSSSQNEGLTATTNSLNHNALRGTGTNGGTGVNGSSDSGIGVLGSSAGGNGGYFLASGSGANGVYSQTTGANSAAVNADAAQGIGLLVTSGGDSSGTAVVVNGVGSTQLLRLDTGGNLSIKGSLKPPTRISGSMSANLLTVSQTGTAAAVSVTSKQNEALIATTSALNHNAVNGSGTSGATGVNGSSDTGIGVIGSSAGGNAGYFYTSGGSSVNAVIGTGMSGATGVNGTSDTGIGVLGNSTSGSAGYFSTSGTGVNGVYAQSTGSNSAAFNGYATQGDAAVFLTKGVHVNGVYAQTTGANSTALNGSASQGIGLLVATGGDASGTAVLVNDSASAQLMRLDTSRNLTISGKLTQQGSHAKSASAPGDNVAFENVGNAALIRGVATVTFPPNVTEAIGAHHYAVFLTPLGDSRGLFVGEKSPIGFLVRESAGGRSSIRFDYRIVAY